MTLEASSDLWGAAVVCDHLAFAFVCEAEFAGHLDRSGFVAAVALSVGGGVEGASVGWDRADMQ